MANLETPEQVREKMAERLWELKKQREQERKETVDRLNEKRFKESKTKFKLIFAAADELRKEGSKFYTQHCQIEREQQLIEKRQKMEEEIRE